MNAELRKAIGSRGGDSNVQNQKGHKKRLKSSLKRLNSNRDRSSNQQTNAHTSVDDLSHVRNNSPPTTNDAWTASLNSKPKLKQILKDPNQITFYKKNKVSAVFKLSPWNGDKIQKRSQIGVDQQTNSGGYNSKNDSKYRLSKTRRRVISAEGIATDPEMYSTSKYRQNLEDAHVAYTMNHSTNEKQPHMI